MRQSVKHTRISVYKGAFLEGQPYASKRVISCLEPIDFWSIITWNQGILALLHPFKVAAIHIERLIMFQRFEPVLVPYCKGFLFFSRDPCCRTGAHIQSSWICGCYFVCWNIVQCGWPMLHRLWRRFHQEIIVVGMPMLCPLNGSAGSAKYWSQESAFVGFSNAGNVAPTIRVSYILDD